MKTKKNLPMPATVTFENKIINADGVDGADCDCLFTAPTFPVFRDTRHLPGCKHYGPVRSIYVLIAIDDDYRVRECIPVSDSDKAQKLYKHLCDLWGAARVCLASREIDDLPDSVMGVLDVPIP